MVILNGLRSLLLFYTQCVIIVCFKFWLNQFEINPETSWQVLVLSVLAPMAPATTSVFASMCFFFQKHNFSFLSCLSCPLTQHYSLNFRIFCKWSLYKLNFSYYVGSNVCLLSKAATHWAHTDSAILCEPSVWWWYRILQKWFRVTLEMLLVWSEFSKHCYSSSCKDTPHADMPNYKNIYSPHKNHFAELLFWFQNHMEVRLATAGTSVFLLATTAALSIPGSGFALRTKIKSFGTQGT